MSVLIDRGRAPRSVIPDVPGRVAARRCALTPMAARSGPERSGKPMEGVEDRQRIDRWIEESQYLIGRVIPGALGDRDRLRSKLEAAEQEAAKLRQEVVDLRKEVSDLQSETQYFRNEHAALAEALSGVLDHLGHVQKPLNDVYRRLQVAQPVGSPA
jgi:hypothetical protein